MSTGIVRTALTEEADLGPESSLFSLGVTDDGTAIIAGASRDVDVSLPVVWEVDPDSGEVEGQWQLPVPQGRSAAARDVVELADGTSIVVGAVFAADGGVPVVWRVTDGSSEPLQVLPCECVWAEAERVVRDAEGTIWIVGREPGWRGNVFVLASTDGGRSWAARSDLTGPSQDLVVAAMDSGVAVVNWTANIDGVSDEPAQWKSSVYVLDGGDVVRSSTTSVPGGVRNGNNVADLTNIGGRLWMVTHRPAQMSLWSSSDGVTWAEVPVPMEQFSSEPYVTPLAVRAVGDDIAVVLLHGDSLDDRLTVMVHDGAGFETWPASIEVPRYYERYIAAWPVAVVDERVLVLDPGWDSSPSFKSVARDVAHDVEMVTIAPMRRLERERVWALAAGPTAMVATIYRQHTIGPDQWVNDIPRLMVGSGQSWIPIDELGGLRSIAGVVASGDGFIVASSSELRTVFIPVSPAGVVDVDRVETAPFQAERVFATPNGGIVAHVTDQVAPIWAKAPDGEWSPLPSLPASSAIRRVCASDDTVVAIGVTQTNQVVVYAFSAGSWSSIGMLPEAAANDSEDPRCDVTSDIVSVAYRRVIVAPDQYSSEWWRVTETDVGGAESGYFDPQWDNDRVTDIRIGAAGEQGLATALRNDDEGSYDAVVWVIDDSVPVAAPVMLAGGPGIQEARAVVRFGGQLVVGGTDGGAAVIWTLPA